MEGGTGEAVGRDWGGVSVGVVVVLGTSRRLATWRWLPPFSSLGGNVGQWRRDGGTHLARYTCVSVATASVTSTHFTITVPDYRLSGELWNRATKLSSESDNTKE